VRIEVEDGQSADVFTESANDRQGDRVVATQADWPQTLVQEFANLLFDGGERLIESELQIAGIAINTFGAEVNAGLCPQV